MKKILLFDVDCACKVFTKEMEIKYLDCNRFGIPRFVPWVHPHNKILNCVACMVDGFLFYKFQIKLDKHGQIVYKVAEILNKNCASPNLNVEKDEELTFEELIEKIKDTTIWKL